MTETLTVVTTDALCTQTKIVDKIATKRRPYVLAVKENQRNPYTAIASLFCTIDLHGKNVSRATEEEILYGKPETRRSFQATIKTR